MRSSQYYNKAIARNQMMARALGRNPDDLDLAILWEDEEETAEELEEEEEDY